MKYFSLLLLSIFLALNSVGQSREKINAEIKDETQPTAKKLDSSKSKKEVRFMTMPKAKIWDLVGEKIPRKNLTTLDGNTFDWNNLEGKPTLVEVWFKDCPPCIKSIPALNSIKKRYGNKMNYLALSLDSAINIKGLIKETNFEYKHIVTAKEYVESIGVSSYPTTFLLNNKTEIVKIIVGVPLLKEDGSEQLKQNEKETIDFIEREILQ